MRTFLLLLAGCGAGLGPPDPASVAAELAYDRLRADSEVPVELKSSGGLPHLVYGRVPVKDLAAHPLDQALAFLTEYADLYGFTAPAEQLYATAVSVSDEGTHVRLRQRVGDLPVFDAGLGVHFHQGAVVLTSGRWLRQAGPFAAPQLDAGDAWDAFVAAGQLFDAALQGDPQRGIYVTWGAEGEPVAVHQVWRLHAQGIVTGTTEGAFWQVDVDAETGGIVNVSDLVATDDDKDFDIMSGFNGTSASCWIFASTADWFDEDGALADYYPAADFNADAQHAYEGAHATYDYYWGTLGRCSYDGDEAEVEIVTHVGQNWVNANANGGCGTIQLGDGFGTTDIVAHEFTHLVDYNAGDLQYTGLSGALDESFADVAAAMVDGNWTMGEGLPGGAIRDLSNPPRFGMPDHLLASVSGDNLGLRPTTGADNGNVHTNSSIPNKAAFLIANGGTHNNIAVSALGAGKVGVLYHVTHTELLSDYDNFQDARDSLYYIAAVWGSTGQNGFTPRDRCSVANAFAAVGIDVGNADIDCDLVPDAADPDNDGDGRADELDNCPTVWNVYQGDTDKDGAGDDCDPDDDGDGAPDRSDNCARVANASQADADGDRIGDACDDTDGDGYLDAFDDCPLVANYTQRDGDGDALGDDCDPDLDGDGIPNAADRCPEDRDPAQLDGDGDAVGDACDNCPLTANADQKDCDGNDVGAACDDALGEILGCLEYQDVAFEAFVNPLDWVALPQLRFDEAARVADFRVQVVISSPDVDWAITDQLGRVVAHAQGVSRYVSAVEFAPRPDYRQLGADGVPLPFATTYRLVVSPETPPGASLFVNLTTR